MRRIALVFAGGGIGTCLRGIAIGNLSAFAEPFPAVVLSINLVGAFILGVIYVLADEKDILPPDVRLFLAVGVLGGFTTFSTFAWQADILVANRHVWLSGVYVLASTVGGLVAARAGIACSHKVLASSQ